MQEPEIFEQPVAAAVAKDYGYPTGTGTNGQYYDNNGHGHGQPPVGTVADNRTGYESGLHTVGNAGEDQSSMSDYDDFVYPEGNPTPFTRFMQANRRDDEKDRKLGIWSTTFLIINRMVGAGIYSTPATIIQYTDSVGATLLFWVLGGFMTFWYVIPLHIPHFVDFANCVT
jgi:hypothetical protein